MKKIIFLLLFTILANSQTIVTPPTGTIQVLANQNFANAKGIYNTNLFNTSFEQYTTAQINLFVTPKLGRVVYDTTKNKLVVFDGTIWQSASGLPYINSVSLPLSVNTQNLSIATANTTTNGVISSNDWNLFNNKQSLLVSGTNIKTVNGISVLGSGNILIPAQVNSDWNATSGLAQILNKPTIQASITATAPLVFASNVLSIPTATTTANGFLNSTDWNIFNNKQPLIVAGTTTQYYRGDKTWQTLDKIAVGLANVDNTSDLNKPISTATQTALNTKIQTANNGLTATGTLVELGGTLTKNTNIAGNFNLTKSGTGNVGIGTTTPTDKLTIQGGAISFNNTTNPVPYVGVQYDQTNDGLAFRTNQAATVLNTTSMFLSRTTGRVGIGTNLISPQAQLHLLNTATSNLLVESTNATLGTNAGTAAIIVKGLPERESALSLTDGTIEYNISRPYNGGSVIDALAFRRGATEFARFNSTGNFGIGTTTPTAKVEIVGSGTTTGNIFELKNSANQTMALFPNNGNIVIGGTQVTTGTPLTINHPLNQGGGTASMRVFNGAAENFRVEGAQVLVSRLAGIGFDLFLLGNLSSNLKYGNAANGYIEIGSDITSYGANINPNKSIVNLKTNVGFLNQTLATQINLLNQSSIIDLTNTTSTAIVKAFYVNPTLIGTSSTKTFRAFESVSGGGYFNTNNVQSSAILQADSTTQGFLPPRMTTTQRNAIVSPAEGLVVYDTTLKKLCVFTTNWQIITSL